VGVQNVREPGRGLHSLLVLVQAGAPQEQRRFGIIGPDTQRRRVGQCEPLALPVLHLRGHVLGQRLNGSRHAIARAGGQADGRHRIRVSEGAHAPGDLLHRGSSLRPTAQHVQRVGASVRGPVSSAE